LARGYVFVSVNYRLTTTNQNPNVTFPAHVQDLARAIAWIYRHVGNYGGDPKRLHLCGHSAGSHLVSLVAADPRWLAAHGLSPAVLRAVVANDTEAYDMPFLSLPDGTLSPTHTDIFGFDPAMWSFASPVTYATGGRAIPSMAICYSAGVNPSLNRQAARRSMATNFQAKLTAAAVRSLVIDGSTHPDGSLKSHAEINQEFGLTNDSVTLAAYEFIESSSDFARLRFQRDFPVGSYDANGEFLGGTEMEEIASHSGRLFAGNGYWKDDPGTDPVKGAQILVKDSASAPWRQDFHFGPDYLTVESLASVTLTTDFNGATLPQPLSLLLAGPQPIVPPYRASVWSRNDSNGAWTEMPLATNQTNQNGVSRANIRALATHLDPVTGVHRVFAGTGRGAVFSGAYDPAAPGRIRWNTVPELPEVPPAETARVYAFAQANGVLYASVASNDNPLDNIGGLFRRVAGPNPSWAFVYEWATVPGKGDGLRGLTAVPAAPGATNQVLLGALESPGHIIRIDPASNHVVTVEFDYKSYFTNLWGSLGGAATLAAYNSMLPVTDPRDGRPLHLIGLWVNHPQDITPPHNGSYYLVRHPDARYEWGRIFDYVQPVPQGAELKGVRCIAASPFPEEDGRVFYFGGYDAGGQSAKHNTAWIYRGELPAIELSSFTGWTPIEIERIGSASWLLTLATSATQTYQLESSPTLGPWTNYGHRITGTGWPYPTLWNSDSNLPMNFIRARVAAP
jgi:hypothetical protein